MKYVSTLISVVDMEMEMVVRRFKATGMTDEQVADRMHVPLDYVLGYLKR